MVGAALVATSALGVGCGDDDGGGSGGTGAMDAGGMGGDSGTGGAGTGGTGGDDTDGGGMGGTGGSSGTGGTGGGTPCDPTINEVDVDENITADTTWECGTYLLKDKIFVTDDATLTIEPGVLVLGDTGIVGSTSALLVTRGAKLNAVGTAAEPIVFTSANPEGARGQGDWGGVVLLGDAPINSGSCVGGTGDACTGGYFETNIEGIDPTDPNGKFGGNDVASDCGDLEYLRIEFAGFVLSGESELNGLTVGACGTGTKLSHIQVHRGSDDGVEFFGGTVGVDHLVLSAISDDSMDWDLGWKGNVQFVVVHQSPTDGDKGFEADNLGGNETASPRSNPTIFNVTMIGNPTKTGMQLREGTLGTLRNFIVTGFQAAVNLAAVTAPLATEWPSDLSIENSLFFGNTAVGNPDSTDDDNGFNEDDAIRAAARNNEFEEDPGLGTDVTDPNYKPTNSAVGGKATPPAGFDTTADYAGAVDPEGDDWTTGWTAFPVD